jgi:WD40 repeat protein
MSHSPFKFLDSYTKEDKDIFFGRETEIEDVYTKVFQSKILLVYGASGTGKSSLISCGLANKFDDTDWLPVNIRRGLNINDSLRNQLEKQVITPLPTSKVTLTKILKSVYLDHFKPIFLVFDQFEELFIFGDREEWMTFAESVRQVMSSSLQVRFVFIIRGEYLEYLTDFEETLPEFFNNRIRIEKMTRTKAVNCITGPCHAVGIEVEEHFAENLLTKLSPNKTEIELTYLQVFLDRIFKKANEKLHDGKAVFSNALLEELGNVGDVLSQFLDEQIELIPDSEKALALLKAFVSTDATKKQISSQQAAEFVKTIGQDLGEKQVDRLIQELVNRRILKDKDEAGRYELRHDSIAAKIFEKITTYERDLIEVNQFIIYAFGEHEKRNFLLNESDLAYIAPYETKLRLSNKVLEFIAKSKTAVSKKNRSRKRIIATIAIISVLFVFSVLALLYANYQKNAADYGFREALKQQNEAIEQKRIAEKQKSIAEEKQQEADKQALIAQQQSAVAFSERQKAIHAGQFAEQQRVIALEQKANAEQSQKESDINAQEATKQKLLADKERSKAERLRMLAIAQAMGAKAVQLQDKDQKVLVAQQAYLFNKQYNGYEYQADIYNGLYSAYEAVNGEKFNTTSAHNGMIKGMVALDESIFITVDADGKIMKTNISTTPAKITVIDSKPYGFQSIALSYDKKILAVGTEEGKLLIYDVASSGMLKELDAHQSALWAIEFDRAGNLFTGGQDMNILKWNLEVFTSQKIMTMVSPINSLTIDNKGYTLVAGLANGVIVSIDVSDLAKLNWNWNFVLAEPDPNPENGYLTMWLGRQLPTNAKMNFKKRPITKVKFNTDGSFLAVGKEDGTILLLKSSGSLFLGDESNRSLSGHKAMISDLRFSSDDKFIISASYDGTSMLWNLESVNQQQIVLDGHGGWILQAGFNTVENEMITCDATGNLKHFAVRMDFYASLLCSSVNRNMAQIEWKNFVGDDIPYSKTCTELTQNK